MASPIEPEVVIEAGPVEGKGEVAPVVAVPVIEAKPAEPVKLTFDAALAQVAADPEHRNKDEEAVKRIARALLG